MVPTQSEKEHAKLSPSASELTQQRLVEVLTYNPASGDFVWRVRQGSACKFDIAGRTDSKGYVQVTIDKRAYLAHRLAFFYMTGVMPVGEVDHIDGVRTNNTWSNLRDVTHGQNQQNIATCRSHNKSSGLLGVTYDPKERKYRARIKINGRNKNIGRFPTAEAAHVAYLEFKSKLHTHNDRLLGGQNGAYAK